MDVRIRTLSGNYKNRTSLSIMSDNIGDSAIEGHDIIDNVEREERSQELLIQDSTVENEAETDTGKPDVIEGHDLIDNVEREEESMQGL
ncbi:hypothetical protein VI817_003601 [Penicillium citrinum]|nr:hypothetical protein VI817_003601 [Penicillium citrinum]